MHQQPNAHYSSSRDLKSKTSILYICNCCSRTPILSYLNERLSRGEPLHGETPVISTNVISGKRHRPKIKHLPTPQNTQCL